MHPDLFYEALFSCPRDDLETLQLLSRTLRDMIVSRSHVLPLRLIYAAWMDYTSFSANRIQINVENRAVCWTSLHDGDFAEAFHRLQHAHINNFYVRIRDSAFLRYWKSQEAADFTVMRIWFLPSQTTDYDALDSVVNHLRPRLTDVGVSDSKMLALLARGSFLSHTRTCRLTVNPDEAFPPPSFILEEPGFPNYELMCRALPPPSSYIIQAPGPSYSMRIGTARLPGNDSNVADGIDGFIESFVRDGCTNQKLQSVGIKWTELNYGQQLPSPKRLSKPTKIDVPLPLPKMYMLGQIVRGGVHRVTQCEMHSFVNAKHRQRMEVYKWIVEHEKDSSLPKAHVLQCRVESL